MTTASNALTTYDAAWANVTGYTQAGTDIPDAVSGAWGDAYGALSTATIQTPTEAARILEIVAEECEGQDATEADLAAIANVVAFLRRPRIGSFAGEGENLR